MIEMQEQQKRMNNIIIYGIKEEVAGENQDPRVLDENFIKAFLEAIEVNVTPKQIIRMKCYCVISENFFIFVTHFIYDSKKHV